MLRPRSLVAMLAAALPLPACAPSRPSTPSLECVTPDSLRAAPLWFSDAIYGMRGTNGGTFIEVYPDSNGWHLGLEPVYSDFTSESRQWPEGAETLAVRWTALPSAQASLAPPQPRPDTSPNTPGVIGDSLTLVLACDTARLIRWHHQRQGDTLLLERRRNRGWPG